MFVYNVSWKPMVGFSNEQLQKYCDTPWYGEKMVTMEKPMTAKKQFEMHRKDGHRVTIEQDNGDSWILSDSDLHKVFTVKLVK